MNNTIILNKFDNYSLDGKLFLIKKGKVISRDILKNEKIVTNETSLQEGEIIGNFFDFSLQNNLLIPESNIEIEALENHTILEEFNFSSKEIIKNIYLEQMIIQLLKKNLIKFFNQLYDTKGYILAILKLYANNKNKISKQKINYKNFNLDRNKFYFYYSILKKENFIEEKEKNIYLNLEKINEYLEKS